MDLLQTVRKEGSRGGVNFSWDDVKSSQHREAYLGHSLMAPVGRWQKGRDLNWYAKADEAELTPEERAERGRERKREELRKVKEAEEDAMARALGLPVPDRSNANNEPLGEGKISQEVNQVLKEALNDGGNKTERGIGFASYGQQGGDDGKEVLKGTRPREERRRDRSRSRERRRDHRDEERSGKRRRRSRSRSGERDRERSHRHRSRSRDRKRRSRSHDRDGEDRNRRRRDRYTEERRRSPYRDEKRNRSRSRPPYEDRRKRRDER